MESMETQKEVTTVSESTPVEITKTIKTVTPPPVSTGSPQKAYETKKTIFRAYQIIWYILGVIEILLIFRVTLKMLGADVNSSFTSLVYMVTNPLATPFSGVFGVDVNQQGAVLEWSTFVAMVVYALVAYALVQVMQLIKPTTPKEVEEKVNNP